MDQMLAERVSRPVSRPAPAGLFWAALGLLLASCGGGPGDGPGGSPGAEVPATARVPAEFVGGAACAGCHQAEADRWRGSQHALAMQAADESTVLGDFDDAEYEYGDVTTRFFRRDGRFLVETDGPDGKPAEFEVRWTFGVTPLQQYLVRLDSGKIQALSIAWDTRPAAQGGQRWFHLYPDERIDFEDPLHWTGVYQRWNTMCADCHSTHVQKGYDAGSGGYATSWSSLSVDCEACHGPGSRHAADPAEAMPAATGSEHSWVFQAGHSIASRVPSERDDAEVQVCAQCHARRAQLTDQHTAGEPLLDAYRPALLDKGLYHADGQIEGEVYVYGSFLESAMAAAGVTCSDCHEPHSAELRADGNDVCGKCHLASTFDRPEHHHHESGSPGAQCVSCHMPTQTYMQVDPRRDHSFRVPRPDLSAALDSPNACNACHGDQSNDWAAERVAEWYPDGRSTEPHFGEALAAGRNWSADGHERLVALIGDTGKPDIVRATAMSLLASRLAPADFDLLRQSLDSGGPLLELAAIDASADLEPDMRVDLLQRFLSGGLRALRIAAGRALLTARGDLSARRQSDLDAAVDEYRAAQVFGSDRPEGRLNLATLAVDEGRFDDAEKIYREAITSFPSAATLYIGLAELDRITGSADAGEAVLREGLAANPDDAGLSLALAFALVREGQREAALPFFESAAEHAPDDPYYRYVLAVATNDTGDTAHALELLRDDYARFPGYPGTLLALATMLRDRGDVPEAYRYASELVDVLPGADNALELKRALEQQL